MQKENMPQSRFSWFDPVNNDPHFIQLLSKMLELNGISFDSLLLSRRGWPWSGNGLCENFLPETLSYSLSAGGIASRVAIAALYVPAMLRAIYLLAKMPQPILISSALWFPRIDGLAVSFLRRIGIRFSILVHRPYSLRSNLFDSGALYFSKSNDYIVLSEFASFFLRNQYGVPDDRITLLPHPNFNVVLDNVSANPELFNSVSKLKDMGKRIVLCCSGLSKGHGTLDVLRIIEAAQVNNPNLFFLIMGKASGSDGKHIAEVLAKRLSGNGNVKMMIGFYSDAEIKAALSLADVVLLPYRSIAQSGVSPMALGQGVPVVVSNVGGMSELVVENHNGIIVRDWDTNSWIAALNSEKYCWTRSQIRDNSERVHGSKPTSKFFSQWISRHQNKDAFNKNV